MEEVFLVIAVGKLREEIAFAAQAQDLLRKTTEVWHADAEHRFRVCHRDDTGIERTVLAVLVLKFEESLLYPIGLVESTSGRI